MYLYYKGKDKDDFLYPSLWICKGCVETLRENVNEGLIKLNKKVTNELVLGYRYVSTYKDAIPFYRKGFVCDCGQMVYVNDNNHVIHHMRIYEVVWKNDDE